MVSKNVLTKMLCISIVVISGCAKKQIVYKPQYVPINVAPAHTRPLEPFPYLPNADENGYLDGCQVFIYNTKVEYALCTEMQRRDTFIRKLTEGRQRFHVYPECEAIIEGVKKRLHTACLP